MTPFAFGPLDPIHLITLSLEPRALRFRLLKKIRKWKKWEYSWLEVYY